LRAAAAATGASALRAIAPSPVFAPDAGNDRSRAAVGPSGGNTQPFNPEWIAIVGQDALAAPGVACT